ncbi:MAG: hypothetical protein Q9170_001313 [Blastenia crenularia]
MTRLAGSGVPKHTEKSDTVVFLVKLLGTTQPITLPRLCQMAGNPVNAGLSEPNLQGKQKGKGRAIDYQKINQLAEGMQKAHEHCQNIKRTIRLSLPPSDSAIATGVVVAADVHSVTQLEAIVRQNPEELLEYIQNLRHRSNENLQVAEKLTDSIIRLQEDFAQFAAEYEKMAPLLDQKRIQCSSDPDQNTQLIKLPEPKQQPVITIEGLSHPSDAKSHIKWPTVPVFAADGRISFKRWAALMVQKCKWDFPRESDRLAYTAARTGGLVAKLLEAYLDEHFRYTFGTLEEMLNTIHEAFGDLDPCATANEQLNNLQQGNMDFSELYAKFTTYMAPPGYDSEQAQLNKLVTKLNLRFRRAWDLQYPQPSTPFEARATLQLQDNNMRAPDKLYPTAQASRPEFEGSSKWARSNTVPSSAPITNALKPNADSYNRQLRDKPIKKAPRKTLSAMEMAQHKAEGRCFGCGKFGHYTRDPHDGKGSFVGPSSFKGTAIQEDSKETSSEEEYEEEFE